MPVFSTRLLCRLASPALLRLAPGSKRPLCSLTFRIVPSSIYNRLKHVPLHGQSSGPSEISRWDVPFETANLFVSSCLHRLRCIASCTHANRATSPQMMRTMSSFATPAVVCQKPVQSIYNQGAAHGCRSFASCMMHVLCVAVWPSKACQVGFLKTLPQQFVRPAALTGWCALFDYFVQAAKQQLDEHCRCPAFVPARRCPVLEIDRRAMCCCCTINTIGPKQPRPREVVNVAVHRLFAVRGGWGKEA